MIAAGAVGAGVGFGLSALSGNSAGPAPAATTASRSTATRPATSTQPRTTTTTSTTAQTVTPVQGAATPRVQVLSAVLFPAATARGRARQRARVSVRVRVTNPDSTSITPPNPLLLNGTDRVGTDPRADSVAGALLKPIAGSASATGELRFEIAGAITQRLTQRPRARLAIVNRIVALKLTISPTPPPA